MKASTDDDRHLFMQLAHCFHFSYQLSKARMMPLKSYYAYCLLVFSCIRLPLVSAHSRWSCPEPRSPSTSIKDGPCGDETNNFLASSEDIVEIKPGPLRVVFEESIYHTGAPFRIALSGDGTDSEACALLDHIPHNDFAERPNFRDESTYTQYAVTIDIPDVNCERCSLHLSNPMTDKIGSAGSQSGIGCTDPDGTCFSSYYSCTRPFKIVGASSAAKRSEYQCPYDSGSGPADWPTAWTGDNGEAVDASVPGVYRRESSIWNANDFTLETAPMRYRQDAGGLCGEDIVDLHAGEGQSPSKAPISLPATKNDEANDIRPEIPASFPTSSPSSDAPEQTPQLSSPSSTSSIQSSGRLCMWIPAAFLSLFAYAL